MQHQLWAYLSAASFFLFNLCSRNAGLLQHFSDLCCLIKSCQVYRRSPTIMTTGTKLQHFVPFARSCQRIWWSLSRPAIKIIRSGSFFGNMNWIASFISVIWCISNNFHKHISLSLQTFPMVCSASNSDEKVDLNFSAAITVQICGSVKCLRYSHLAFESVLVVGDVWNIN